MPPAYEKEKKKREEKEDEEGKEDRLFERPAAHDMIACDRIMKGKRGEKKTKPPRSEKKKKNMRSPRTPAHHRGCFLSEEHRFRGRKEEKAPAEKKQGSR